MSRRQRFPGIDDKTYDTILSRSLEITEGWQPLRDYATVGIALGAGLRTKEIQLAELRNIDTNDWTIYVEHVKGEGTYGQARVVPIRPEWRPIISRYLEVRKTVMTDNPYLFSTERNNLGYLSDNAVRTGKKRVEKDTGTSFELRACRRTFGQKAIDEGIPPENTSLLMGHTTTKTTETYYCRKRPDKAVRETIKFWDEKARNEVVN